MLTQCSFTENLWDANENLFRKFPELYLMLTEGEVKVFAIPGIKVGEFSANFSRNKLSFSEMRIPEQ
jgi:hypothetical protein